MNLINQRWVGNKNEKQKCEVIVMKQAIVNGVSYLGELVVEENGNVVVKDAIKTGNVVTRADITRYFQEANVGNLESVEFGGNGISYSVMDLTDDNQNYIKIAELVMDQAKSVAVRKLENQEFVGELGKLTGCSNGGNAKVATPNVWQA